jgi:DNA-cytosine methyltransferase
VVGLDIAFHDCGFDIVQMVELEAKYVQTLNLNSLPGKGLENSRAICIDIREFIPTPDLKVDFIIGGPPCQTFSAAGRRAAGVAGTSDARGTLFQEYVRLLKTLQPKGFLFENVYGIIGAQKGEAWALIQTAFKEAGYTIHFRVLDAADYGVPSIENVYLLLVSGKGIIYFLIQLMAQIPLIENLFTQQEKQLKVLIYRMLMRVLEEGTDTCLQIYRPV